MVFLISQRERERERNRSIFKEIYIYFPNYISPASPQIQSRAFIPDVYNKQDGSPKQRPIMLVKKVFPNVYNDAEGTTAAGNAGPVSYLPIQYIQSHLSGTGLRNLHVLSHKIVTNTK